MSKDNKQWGHHQKLSVERQQQQQLHHHRQQESWQDLHQLQNFHHIFAIAVTNVSSHRQKTVQAIDPRKKGW